MVPYSIYTDTGRRLHIGRADVYPDGDRGVSLCGDEGVWRPYRPTSRMRTCQRCKRLYYAAIADRAARTGMVARMVTTDESQGRPC